MNKAGVTRCHSFLKSMNFEQIPPTDNQKEKGSQNDQEENSQKKKERLAREEWEQEFEEQFGDLAQDLPSEKYEEKKRKWIEDKMEDTREVEESNQITEQKEEEKREAQKDDLSGLRRREMMYKKMNKTVEEITGIKDKGTTKEQQEQWTQEQWQQWREQWMDCLKSVDPEEIEEDEHTVMMADVSYLNLLNELGHNAGDKLIRDAGRSFQERNVDGYRHGGDEFTALFDNREDAQEKTKEIKEDFKQQEVAELLRTEYGVEPSLDTGEAEFDEALQVFQNLVGHKEAKQEMLKKDPLNQLNDLWVEIADQRAQFNKAQKRIAVLMDKYENDRDTYDKIVGFLRKGAYSIQDHEVEELIENNADTEDIKNKVLEKQERKIGNFNKENASFKDLKKKYIWEALRAQ